MITARLTVDSFALRRPVAVAVALPYAVLAERPPFKTVWALHCALRGGDFFFDELSLGQYVEKAGVAVVAPSLGNACFVNSRYEAQGDFLRLELKPVLQETLALSKERADNYLLGVSMGASGAARWALKAPGEFAAAALVSGIYDPLFPMDERAKKSRELRPLAQLFCEKIAPLFLLGEDGQVNPEADFRPLYAQAAAAGAPRLGLWCGEKDYLCLEPSRHFVDCCREAGLEAELRTAPGTHNLDFWRPAVAEAMGWLLKGAQ